MLPLGAPFPDQKMMGACQGLPPFFPHISSPNRLLPPSQPSSNLPPLLFTAPMLPASLTICENFIPVT